MLTLGLSCLSKPSPDNSIDTKSPSCWHQLQSVYFHPNSFIYEFFATRLVRLVNDVRAAVRYLEGDKGSDIEF